MKRILIVAVCLLTALSAAACSISGASSVTDTSKEESGGATEASKEESVFSEESLTQQETESKISEESETMKIRVQAGENEFSATLADNAAAAAFFEMLKKAPVVIEMSDYSGFEKVGALGTALPESNSQTTTVCGDIVLYNGDQIVIFYGSNSWSYTRLGKIDDLSGWEEALGRGEITVTFTALES